MQTVRHRKVVPENLEQHQGNHLIVFNLGGLTVAKLNQIKLNLIMNLEPSIHTPLTNEAASNRYLLHPWKRRRWHNGIRSLDLSSFKILLEERIKQKLKIMF